MQPNEAQIIQVETTLKARYFGIVAALPGNHDAGQQESNRLSRSLAAFAIEKLACVAPVDAAAAVTDGGNDNGIDAVHFDRLKNRLWVVQAKIGAAANMGENKKLCDGIRDLVDRRWTKFNAAFVRLQPDIEAALDSEGLLIIGCQVHLGTGLGTHAVDDLDKLKADLNKFFQRFDWKDYGVDGVHGWLTAEYVVHVPPITLVLEKWYGVPGPKKAFYGQVAASHLAALYGTHGKALFARNIRDFLGADGVNAAIAETATQHASDLFYLNNGLTAICTSITPLPGATNDAGSFTLQGFSIVNGAQTVGSLGSIVAAGTVLSADAKVLMTLIEIGTAADDLGPRITRARNTQNAIRGLHFAALDPQQERLRQELAVSGISYHYRPSLAATVGGPDTFTIQQGALALACFSGTTATIVVAKKEIGQLYDSNGPIYPTLFHKSLSGVHLYRYVRVYEYITNVLLTTKTAETGVRAAFFRHGRYFIMHIIARKHRPFLDTPDLVLSKEDELALSRIALDTAELVWDVAERQVYQQGYLSVFRNGTDAEPLARAVMSEIATREAATKTAAAGVAAPASATAVTGMAVGVVAVQVAPAPAPGTTATAAPTTASPGGQQGTVL